ncbi:MAG: DNA-processing protein DprA [Oscillospiraceae bacterium]|nr:DNA-processing protein DprA [Oscillospiraceae bacterium]
MASLNYWLWLTTRQGLSPRTAGRLLQIFGSPERLFFADRAELKANGVSERLIELLGERSLVGGRQIMEKCRVLGQRILTLDDAEYPLRLKNIPDPPLVLYVKGTLPAVDDEAVITVVGTRKCSDYGLRAANRIGRELASGGAVVVTGLARGIDSTAAWGALCAGGKVIGVAGGGADVIYPPENGRLYEAVAENGAVISEYPPGTEPFRGHFPARNRIMSGLALGVVVAEAPLKSGARITAADALEQGRDVFAVPGPIDLEACAGSNQLLREGAIPATCGNDILEEYQARFPERICLREASAEDILPEIDNRETEDYTSFQEETEFAPEMQEKAALSLAELSEEEAAVIRAITREDMPVDEIIAQSGLGAAATLAALTMLEISGAVTRGEGKRYTRNIG